MTMPAMPGDEYTCENGGTFMTTWTAEEAAAEYAALWEPDGSGTANVCDDCFKKIMAMAQA